MTDKKEELAPELAPDPEEDELDDLDGAPVSLNHKSSN